MNKTLTYIDDEIKMLNSYIEECNEMINIYKKLFEKSGDPIDAHPIEAYKESIEFVEKKIERLQECKNEIIDQNKVYTLEDCKKMWEEAGWKWKERDDYHNGKDYRLYFVTKNEYSVYQPRIFFRKYDNTYYAFEGYDTTDFEGYPITEIRVLHITLDLQNLITKTIKALEKEEK